MARLLAAPWLRRREKLVTLAHGPQGIWRTQSVDQGRKARNVQCGQERRSSLRLSSWSGQAAYVELRSLNKAQQARQLGLAEIRSTQARRSVALSRLGRPGGE